MELAENVVIAQRFRLNRLLGRGGMGSVWHATHLGLDVPCAVKFIEGAHSSLGDATARFEREAKAAAQLRSPNVVQILDHGVFDGTPYIAMELLEGEELGSRLRRLQRIAPREVLAIVRDVSRALAKAHTLGIVHRDLKPDNVFLVRDDDREIAKVLDFGIAKTQSTDLHAAKTQTGAMLGTPYYMSPEQAQGTRTVDSRSDLWSLAVIVFECLTGLRPFESDALGDLLMKILVLPIPVPSSVAQVPLGFDAWWARAVARDPAHRFQSARDFAESLAAALGGGVDVVGPIGVPAAAGSGAAPNTPQPGAAPARTAPWTPNPGGQPGGGVWTPSPALPPGAPWTPPPGEAPLAHTAGGAISRTLGGAPKTRKSAPAIAVAVSAFALVAVVGIAGAVVMATRARGGAASAASAPPPATSAIVTPPAPARPDPAATGAGATADGAATTADANAAAARGGAGQASQTDAPRAGEGGATSATSADDARAAGAGSKGTAAASTATRTPKPKPTATADAPTPDRAGF